MSRWRSLHNPDPRTIPDGPGVYALYAANGGLRYIGSSGRLRMRLRGRIDPGATVKLSECRSGENWQARESRLIYRLKPQENRAGTKALGWAARCDSPPPLKVRTKQVNFECPEDLFERLRDAGLRREAAVMVSHMLREAVAEKVAREERKK